MAKARFKIVGIKHPGRVDLYQYGTINLCEQSDERLAKILAETGCRFIQPAIDAPAITIKKIKR